MIVGIMEDKFQNSSYHLSFKVNLLRSNMDLYLKNITSFNNEEAKRFYKNIGRKITDMKCQKEPNDNLIIDVYWCHRKQRLLAQHIKRQKEM
jgi:hypothetical protein